MRTLSAGCVSRLPVLSQCGRIVNGLKLSRHVLGDLDKPVFLTCRPVYRLLVRPVLAFVCCRIEELMSSNCLSQLPQCALRSIVTPISNPTRYGSDLFAFFQSDRSEAEYNETYH